MEKNTFLRKAQEIAGSDWDDELSVILSTGYDTQLIFSQNDFTKFIEDGDPDDAALKKKLTKLIKTYKNAKDNKLSERASNPPGTVADPAVTEAISKRLPLLGVHNLKAISDAHRLSMSAENIIGPLLEEYLAVKLAPYGYIHCWGSILRAVDFVTQTGTVLQVKNSNNSENSSSSKVRQGTDIKKWFRRFSTREAFNWDDLNAQLEIPTENRLTEEGFMDFIGQVIQQNPEALALEDSNIWGSTGELEEL